MRFIASIFRNIWRDSLWGAQLLPILWQALLTWLETENSIPSLEELTESIVAEPFQGNVTNAETFQSERTSVSVLAELTAPVFTNWDNPEDNIFSRLWLD